MKSKATIGGLKKSSELKWNHKNPKEPNAITRNQWKPLQQKESTRKEELSKKFQVKFNRSVREVAKEKGYNMVVTTQALVYSEGVSDISGDVVVLMNKDYE